MIWMTWRQFRPAAITAAAALVVLAAALAATRPTLMSLYASAHLPGCHARCAADAGTFLNSVQVNYTTKIYWAGLGIMYLVPGVLGLFWGAPLIARELDSGTFRLAWAQSITRARWATIKLVLIGAATLLTAGLMSLLIGWWSSPLYQAANQAGPNMLSISRFSAKLFSATGIVPIGYAAFAFALGTAAGVLLRRTIPAMAVTLGIFAVIQVLVPILVRPHIIPPVQTTQPLSAVHLNNNTTTITAAQGNGHNRNAGLLPADDTIRSVDGQRVISASDLRSVIASLGPRDNLTVVWQDQSGQTHSSVLALSRTYETIGPGGSPLLVDGLSGQPGALILSSRMVDAAGQTLTTLPSACVHRIDGSTATDVSCLAGHGIKIAASYQPTSRYWALQSAETGMYLVLAAGLGGVSYWAVRRRQRSA